MARYQHINNEIVKTGTQMNLRVQTPTDHNRTWNLKKSFFSSLETWKRTEEIIYLGVNFGTDNFVMIRLQVKVSYHIAKAKVRVFIVRVDKCIFMLVIADLPWEKMPWKLHLFSHVLLPCFSGFVWVNISDNFYITTKILLSFRSERKVRSKYLSYGFLLITLHKLENEMFHVFDEGI